MAALVNYTCKSFIKLTPDVWHSSVSYSATMLYFAFNSNTSTIYLFTSSKPAKVVESDGQLISVIFLICMFMMKLGFIFISFELMQSRQSKSYSTQYFVCTFLDNCIVLQTICYFLEFCGRHKISESWLSEGPIWLLLRDSGYVVIYTQ